MRRTRLSFPAGAGAGALMAAALFAPVLAPRPWTFPEDHGAHRAWQTEWWYYTGHLKTDAGRSYGYELVFFRFAPDPGDSIPATFAGWKPAELYPAHLALTDEAGRRFIFHEKVERSVGRMAGADSADLHVWCGPWRSDRVGSAHHLEGSSAEFSLSLELVPLKPPVLHGDKGLSHKGPHPGQASYYYSLTRMKTLGVLTLGPETANVTGVSWMDHEFFTGEIDTTLTGWDWFSLQMDDDTELMLYRLRGKAGSADWPSGTFVRSDGSAVALGRGDFTIESGASWHSDKTGVTYPAAWKVAIPKAGLTVELTPTVPDQELDTRGSTGVVYWEGSVTIKGTRDGRSVGGQGYVELTGYSGSTPLSRGSR